MNRVAKRAGATRPAGATQTSDLVGIGNALVDVLVPVGDDFLTARRIPKGGMMLVDEARSDALYADLVRIHDATKAVDAKAVIERSGGSCANSLAGFAQLGGCGAFIGRVRDDPLGAAFRRDMVTLGIDFATPAATDGPATGKCLVMISPDAERSMATFLGAAGELGPADIAADVIASAEITYLEGYLYDRDAAKQAFAKSAALAHNARRTVALTLSDAFCVDRHRADFRHLVDGHVDMLFANEEEILSLYEAGSGLAEVVAHLRAHEGIFCITRGAKGALILAGDALDEIAAEPVPTPVDSTGAGDQFAAGFLFGYSRGRPLAECGRLGAIAAAEVITHYGARPESDLRPHMQRV